MFGFERLTLYHIEHSRINLLSTYAMPDDLPEGFNLCCLKLMKVYSKRKFLISLDLTKTYLVHLRVKAGVAELKAIK